MCAEYYSINCSSPDNACYNTSSEYICSGTDETSCASNYSINCSSPDNACYNTGSALYVYDLFSKT